jgi:hypothetical protein
LRQDNGGVALKDRISSHASLTKRIPFSGIFHGDKKIIPGNNINRLNNRVKNRDVNNLRRNKAIHRKPVERTKTDALGIKKRLIDTAAHVRIQHDRARIGRLGNCIKYNRRIVLSGGNKKRSKKNNRA